MSADLAEPFRVLQPGSRRTSEWLTDSFLGRLPEPLRDQLWARGRENWLRDEPGSTDELLVVARGTVKVFHHGIVGGHRLVDLAGPGDLVDPQAVFAPGVGASYSSVRQRSLVVRFARTRFEEFLTTNPEAMTCLAQVLSASASRQSTLHTRADQPVADRVYALLEEWGTRHGWRIPLLLDDGHSDGVLLSLTQSDIAAGLGVSTVSVERAVRSLRQAGQVRTQYGSIKVLPRR
jgi:CRP-like cAMP-binding protein